MLRVVDGLQTSHSTLTWFPMSLRAASSRYCKGLPAAVKSTASRVAAVVDPLPSALRSIAQCGAVAAMVAVRADCPTSASTASVALPAMKFMSGSRPGFCSGADCIRPMRYVAALCHVVRCSWLCRCNFASRAPEPARLPSSRRTVSCISSST